MISPSPCSRAFVASIAVGLFVMTCGVLMLTDDMGYTRDESFYFRYGRQYAEWFQALEAADTAGDVHKVSLVVRSSTLGLGILSIRR